MFLESVCSHLPSRSTLRPKILAGPDPATAFLRWVTTPGDDGEQPPSRDEIFGHTVSGGGGRSPTGVGDSSTEPAHGIASIYLRGRCPRNVVSVGWQVQSRPPSSSAFISLGPPGQVLVVEATTDQ